MVGSSERSGATERGGVSDGEVILSVRDGESGYKYGWGSHNNVFLSTEEYLTLRREIPAADRYIDRFSEKLKQKGYRYPNHFAAIMQWWEEDKRKEVSEVGGSEPPRGSFDTDEFFEAAVRRSLGEFEAE